ncbi:MAG: ParA family protein [Candidatus Tectomicrobia bacterium]|nr:ParA family protein [Candidatus Tectomicrobia bacterium]
MNHRTIAVINQKGGVGKTTSVANIGTGLKILEKKVLLVDFDAQAHLTYSLGLEPDDLKYVVYNLLNAEAEIDDVLIGQDGISLLPSSIDLSAAEIKFANTAGKETLLKSVLDKVTGYDFIIVDCPPNLGLLTVNALAAVQEVFVPMQAEALSIRGLNKISDMVEKVRQTVNSDLRITGIILNQFDRRLKLHNQVRDNLQRYFSDVLFQTSIRKNISLAEAPGFGQSIFDYAPRSHGAADYLSLCREILNGG